MRRQSRKATFCRRVFPKWRNPRRTRDSADEHTIFQAKTSSKGTKTPRKIDDFPKCFLAPYGARAASDGVAPQTMLRAALKRSLRLRTLLWRRRCTTNNAACGIETTMRCMLSSSVVCCTTNNAACGIETLHSLCKAVLIIGCTTNNAACGIETNQYMPVGHEGGRLHHKQCCVRH